MAQYAAVRTATTPAEALLKVFTLSRICCAMPLSLISCKPVPSTSQTPACAMFHNPVAPEPVKPKAKNNGSAISARWGGGAPVAS